MLSKLVKLPVLRAFAAGPYRRWFDDQPMPAVGQLAFVTAMALFCELLSERGSGPQRLQQCYKEENNSSG